MVGVISKESLSIIEKFKVLSIALNKQLLTLLLPPVRLLLHLLPQPMKYGTEVNDPPLR